MAVKKYVADKIVCLSSDAKPMDVADGATLFESDTSVYYIKAGGVWVPMPGASPITIWPYAYSALIQGTWVWSYAATLFAGYIFYNTSNADGDQLDYEVFLGMGTYTFYLVHNRNTNRGILDLLIDDVSQGTIDCYGASDPINEKTIADIVISTAGLKTVSIKVNGKNGSSTGYYLAPSLMVLRRTA